MIYRIVYHPANALPYIIHEVATYHPVPGQEYMHYEQAKAAMLKLNEEAAHG